MSRLNPFDPFQNLMLPGTGYQPVQRIQPIRNKAEEDSLLSQLTGKVLGGVGYLGGVLDKTFGGRALRGALGGKPEELLSLIPGSDTLGITNEANRVSGEDLAKHWGVLEGEGEKGSFELRDLVGPAIEMGLDPSMYLSLGAGALSKGGTIAKKIGIAPKGWGAGAKRAGTTLEQAIAGNPELLASAQHAANRSGINLAEVMGEKLGGNVGIGLPWGHNLATADISPVTDAIGGMIGKVTPEWAKKAGGKIGETLAPLGRSIAAQFDKSRMGAIDPIGVETAQEASQIEAKRQAKIHMDFAQGVRTTKDAGMIDRSGGDLIRAAREKILSPLPGELGEPLRQSMQAVSNLSDPAFEGGVRVGIRNPTSKMEGYSARQRGFLPNDRVGIGAKEAIPTQVGAMKGRIDPFRDLPLGTNSINSLSLDPELAGIAHTVPADQLQNRLAQSAAIIRQHTLQMTPEMESQYHLLSQIPADVMAEGPQVIKDFLAASATNTPEEEHLLRLLSGIEDLPNAVANKEKWGGQVQQSKDLADIMANRHPDYLKAQMPYFPNHPLMDAYTTAQHSAIAETGAEAKAKMLARAATTSGIAGGTPINDALKELGLADYGHGPAQQIVAAEMERLGKAAPGMLQQPATLAGPGPHPGMAQLGSPQIPGLADASDAFSGLFVPPDVMTSAKRYGQSARAPESLRPALDFVDTLTNWFRAGNTLWPGSMVRNKGGNIALNLQHGGLGLESGQAAGKLLAGGEIPGAAKLLPGFVGTDKQATEKLADMAFAYAGAGKGRGSAMEATGIATDPVKSILEMIPGMAPEKWSDLLNPKNIVPTSLEEAKSLPAIRGAFGYTQDVSKPVVAGRKIAKKLEDQDLVAHFLEKIMGGSTPEVAGQEAKTALGDFSNLTGFERDVMRRLMPFYSWQRSVAPGIAKNIAEHPGGPIPQSIRASNAFREQAGYVPPHVGQGLAIPVGQEDDGQQRFLSGLGLPHEQILDMLKTGPQGAENTLMGLLSQLNPLLKAPLEYATGKQFFSGRDLDTLHGPTGSTALDQLIMNSPAARAYTTGRTLFDPRKGPLEELLNLGTGARITDVNVEKSRSAEVQKLIADEMAGNGAIRQFSTPYVRPEDVPNLSPQDLALLRLQRTLEMEGQKRARDQKRIGVKKAA